MDPDDGPWDPSLVSKTRLSVCVRRDLACLSVLTSEQFSALQAKAIINKYLNNAGSTLGTSELNLVGGDNLCSLDLEKIGNITQESLR